MPRPTNHPMHQLALQLEPTPRHPLDPQTRAALISALADLLLEAYGAESLTQVVEPGASHES